MSWCLVVGVLLVAPWGDPSGWIKARYTLDGDSVESFTSLALLYKALRPDGVVVYTSDTLAGRVPRPTIADSLGAGYDAGITGPVREWVKGFSCGLPLDVTVLPGVIGGSSVVVEGSARDYYYLMLYDLVERVAGGGFSGIVFDATHGINYMTSMGLQAAREAAAILGVARGGRAVLEVYNSSPVVLDSAVRGVCGRSPGMPCMPRDAGACQSVMVEAPVHRVSREELGGSYLVSTLDTILSGVGSSVPRVLSATRFGGREAGESIRGILEGVRGDLREALLVVRLARYGLVPELVYRLHSLGDPVYVFERAILSVLEAWRELVSVDLVGDRVVVHRGARLEEGFRILVYALAVSKIYKSLEDGASLSLGRAWSMAERLYSRDSIMGVVQAREKEKLERKLRRLIEKTGGEITGWIPLNLVHSEDRNRCKEPRDCGVFKRDLIAHGGWHSCIVEVHPVYNGGELDFNASTFRLRGDAACKREGRLLSVWDAIGV